MKQLIEEQDIIEHFANLEHERWSKWQKYLHSKMFKSFDYDGIETFQLPKDLIIHWERQINTPYADLSEQEKQSDRNEVMPYVNWHKQSLKQFIDGLIEREEGTITGIGILDESNLSWTWDVAKKNTIGYLKKLKEELN